MPNPPEKDPLSWLRSVIAYVTSPVKRDQGPGQTAATNALRTAGSIPSIRPLVAPSRPAARPTSSAGPLVTRDQARIQAEEVRLRLSGRVHSSRRPRKKPGA